MFFLFILAMVLGSWLSSKVLLPLGLIILTAPVVLINVLTVKKDRDGISKFSDFYAYISALILCYFLGDFFAYIVTPISVGQSFRYLYYATGLFAASYAVYGLTEPWPDGIPIWRKYWQILICAAGFIIGTYLRVFM